MGVSQEVWVSQGVGQRVDKLQVTGSQIQPQTLTPKRDHHLLWVNSLFFFFLKNRLYFESATSRRLRFLPYIQYYITRRKKLEQYAIRVAQEICNNFSLNNIVHT